MKATGALERRLREGRDEGRKLLVPYVTGGLGGWMDALRAAAANGADAIEVGIPFSDPVMDGPVIQAASERALADGATPISILDELRDADVDVPIAVMCYFNTIHAAGCDRFAAMLASAGVSAAIVPDLPLEESGPWCASADAHSVETVMLVAPTAPDERVARVVARSRGFVYAVGLLGVTGERDELATSALTLAARVKPATDLPVLIGVGVSNASQAAEAVTIADGVVMGASVVRRLMDGGADAVGDFVAEVRHELDGVTREMPNR